MDFDDNCIFKHSFAFFHIFPFLEHFFIFFRVLFVFLMHYLVKCSLYIKIFCLRESLLFYFITSLLHVFQKMGSHDTYVVHILCGVNRCPLAWPSSIEVSSAIDLNQTYNSFTNRIITVVSLHFFKKRWSRDLKHRWKIGYISKCIFWYMHIRRH